VYPGQGFAQTPKWQRGLKVPAGSSETRRHSAIDVFSGSPVSCRPICFWN